MLRRVGVGVLIGMALAGANSIASAAAMPTCMVTGFILEQSHYGGGAGALEFLSVGGFSGCFGAYPFQGVTASALGYPNTTTNNYTELAAALKHWNSIDGVPAVAQWVNLSPTVAAAMKAAGIDPTLFLQWVNDYNASAWAGTGVRVPTAAPPVWPSFVSKGFVSDPATIAGGAADEAVPTPKPTPPAQAAPQQPVNPTQAPSPALSAPPTTPTGSGTEADSAQTPATSTMPVDNPTTGIRPVPKVAAAPATSPGVVPAAVTVAGTTVPCVVERLCRQGVIANDRWRNTPWYEKAGLDVWRHRWPAVTAIAILGGVVLGGRAVVIGRRNLTWYGNVRGPR